MVSIKPGLDDIAAVDEAVVLLCQVCAAALYR